jgi:hypothetical protein
MASNTLTQAQVAMIADYKRVEAASIHIRQGQMIYAADVHLGYLKPAFGLALIDRPKGFVSVAIDGSFRFMEGRYSH